MSAWDCMQALQDKKRKAQQALERKQRRNAAMQAMLAKPGYQGTVLGSAIEMAHEDSDWILDGSQRCALKPSIGLLLSCCFVLPRGMKWSPATAGARERLGSGPTSARYRVVP